MGSRSADFKTPLARLSYPHLFKAQKMDDGGEKFNCSLIIPKTADLSVLVNAVKDAVKAEWQDKGLEELKKGLIKNPIIDGALPKWADKAELGPDVVFIRPGSKQQPPCVNARALPAREDELYAGCYVYAVLNAFTWLDKRQGKGVSFGLQAVQFVKDGERLGGGGVDPSKFFEAIVDDEAAAGASAPVGDASSMFT